MVFSITKRYPCSVCGTTNIHREDWFLVVENRWLDRLRIFSWHPSLASRAGFLSACGREHLKVLVAHWLEHASLRLVTKLEPPSPAAGEVRPSPEQSDVVAGLAVRLLGDLAVCREPFSRSWTGSAESLECIIRALAPVQEPVRESREAVEPRAPILHAAGGPAPLGLPLQ